MSENKTDKLELLELTMRNFLSYGNQDTVVNLTNPGTTLIIGKDYDNGGGTANGVGKTTILRGIVYALFDDPMSKETKLDELINNINKGNMRVSVKFQKNGHIYEVVRQRKGKNGNTVQLTEDGVPITRDSVDNTNKYITEKIIGYSMDLFIRIVVFSAGNEPFFSLPTSGAKHPTQSDIIEELFNLTSLTEKAEIAKKEIKANEQKMEIIKAKIEQIEREKERHAVQVTTTQSRIDAWDEDHIGKLTKLNASLRAVAGIDFDAQQDAFTKRSAKIAEFKEFNAVISRASGWKKSQEVKIDQTQARVTEMEGIDFDAEINTHKQLIDAKASKEKLGLLLNKAMEFDEDLVTKKTKLSKDLAKIEKIDFVAQRTLLELLITNEESLAKNRRDLKAKEKELQDLQTSLTKMYAEHKHLSDATCPYCMQHFAGADDKLDALGTNLSGVQDSMKLVQFSIDDINDQIKTSKTFITETESSITVSTLEELTKLQSEGEGLQTRIADLNNTNNPHMVELVTLVNGEGLSNDDIFDAATKQLDADSVVIQDLKAKVSKYSVSELTQMKSDKVSVADRLVELTKEVNPFVEFIEETIGKKLRPTQDIADACESTLDAITDAITDLDTAITYKSLEDLLEAKNESLTLQDRIDEIAATTNPHVAAMDELKAMNLDEAEYTAINEYVSLVEHQKFLVKLLTKSDSFVRKALIEENIPYLNLQLKQYLIELGLPHKVTFTNTMTASISQLGRTIGFHMLSTGQKARVNLALNWAFRDVLQQMHGRVNFCLLDEVLDVGLCSVGISAAIKMLKRRAAEEAMTMFVISHRDEVDGAFGKTMHVEMRNGFSRILNDNE